MNDLYRLALLLLICPAVAHAADWPHWGGDGDRNMVAAETNLPTSAEAGEPADGSEEIDLSKTKNVKWVAKVGNQAYGNPTVANGKVYVGTNNASPRDKAIADD